MRKLMQRAAVLAVSCLCLAGLAGPAGAQDLLVAQVASSTNPQSTFNVKAMQAGIKAYFDTVNAQGGIGGKQIKLVTRDDDLNAGKMVAATKEVIADKQVLALVGFLNTAGLTEVSKLNLAGEAGIAMIAPANGNRNIIAADNFFPFRSGYTEEVSALIKEAKGTQKKRIAVLYFNTAFGPPMSQFAQTTAKNEGLELVANVPVEVAPDKMDASLKEAVATIAKANPEAIVLICAGRVANEFVRLVKDSPAASAQLYAMSVIQSDDLVKAVGTAKARGLVSAQAVPYPFSPSLPVVAEYLRLLKQNVPGETPSFSGLEGFIGAKITVEAIKRAGPGPTRDKILKALNNLGEYDLGGVYVSYSAKGRSGWGRIDLTIIDGSGKLQR